MVAEEMTEPSVVALGAECSLLTLDEVDSTNTWLRNAAANLGDSGRGHGLVVRARRQNAGRGQRGNSWESEPGLNLTLSIFLRPEGVEPSAQFLISEAVAIAAVEAVAPVLDEAGLKAEVKWPNDIYVGNRKLAGILIEHSLSGHRIDWSIAGIGINVNQTVFRSDAPNPVSLAMLAGRDNIDMEPILSRFANATVENLRLSRDELHSRYTACLWRRSGFHPYLDNLRGDTFLGAIADIAPTGHLTLRLPDGSMRTFAFKEVAAL